MIIFTYMAYLIAMACVAVVFGVAVINHFHLVDPDTKKEKIKAANFVFWMFVIFGITEYILITAVFFL